MVKLKIGLYKCTELATINLWLKKSGLKDSMTNVTFHKRMLMYQGLSYDPFEHSYFLNGYNVS